MKNFIFTFLVVIIVFIYFPIFAQPSDFEACLTTDNVNIRFGPTTSSNIRMVGDSGDCFQLWERGYINPEENLNPWVKTTGGWIYEPLVEIRELEITSTPQPTNTPFPTPTQEVIATETPENSDYEPIFCILCLFFNAQNN